MVLDSKVAAREEAYEKAAGQTSVTLSCRRTQTLRETEKTSSSAKTLSEKAASGQQPQFSFSRAVTGISEVWGRGGLVGRFGRQML